MEEEKQWLLKTNRKWTRIWGVQTTYANLEQTKEGNGRESQCENVVASHKE